MKKTEFIEELKKIGINPNQEQLNQLDIYYNFLIKSNKNINLTNIVEEEAVYLKHFYDSLTIVKIIDLNQIKTLCDVGSGAGFPGVVLKIFFPHLEIILVDSLNKRVKFLNELIELLKLSNIKAIHQRMEVYSLEKKEYFDIITARAVAKIRTLNEISVLALKTNGKLIYLKSNLDLEIENIQHNLKKLGLIFLKKEEFCLPIENSLRTLICFQKKCSTRKEFPRKFKEIKDKQL
ncbi:MAG: 16S rRNA (guanine(527)-N(7))-methyltransferase RsmG [Bacilli bacterium]